MVDFGLDTIKLACDARVPSLLCLVLTLEVVLLSAAQDHCSDWVLTISLLISAPRSPDPRDNVLLGTDPTEVGSESPLEEGGKDGEGREGTGTRLILPELGID